MAAKKTKRQLLSFDELAESFSRDCQRWELLNCHPMWFDLSPYLWDDKFSWTAVFRAEYGADPDDFEVRTDGHATALQALRKLRSMLRAAFRENHMIYYGTPAPDARAP